MSEQIFRHARISAADLRAQIERETTPGEIFSVKIERYAERRAVAELLWAEDARYELVAFYTDSVQLRRMV